MRVEANFAMFEAGEGKRESRHFAAFECAQHNASSSSECDSQGERGYVGIVKAPDFLFQAQHRLDVRNCFQIADSDCGLSHQARHPTVAWPSNIRGSARFLLM